MLFCGPGLPVALRLGRVIYCHMVENDAPLPFPHFTVLKASAGSGKTHALAQRFVRFLLSEHVPNNRLNNLLAITFSNNAAKEMKERIVDFLKKICLGDRETVSEFAASLSLPADELRGRAEETLEEILSNYSDFQVKTIDSFMTTVFKASALDFGYNPDFDILLANDSLTAYAFDLFLRKVRADTKESVFMNKIVDIIMDNRGGDSSYLWDPTEQILGEVKEIYRKLAATGKPASTVDYAPAMEEIRRDIRARAEELERMIGDSGLAISKASSFTSLISAVKAGRFPDLVGKGMKSLPVRKPGAGQNLDAYEAVVQKWQDLEASVAAYTKLYACAYYTPYLRAYEGFTDILEKAKRHEGKIFIEDVNKRLAEYLSREVVPDIYFRLGDVIFHYLIDEFQDTSPVQWHNLFPLLENSLSQQGSLFAVGDTKQAIYGFRDADYTIMRSVEEKNPFPSASHAVEELYVNYRSAGAVTRFARKVFQEMLPPVEGYGRAAKATGLLNYRQMVRKNREDEGFVETWLVERDDEEPSEKEKLAEILDDLLARGYRYSDIAILTDKNDDVVKVTTWLNERRTPFLSYSSLDIRRRKITGEIIALLSFLDSPPDDLAFATFILGDIFRAVLAKRGRQTDVERLHRLCFTNRDRDDRPLYKAFQEEMGDLWDEYFARPFTLSGYLPLYDLVVHVYNIFEVFGLFGKSEEAALTRVLEVVKDLEAKGGGLRNFLDEGLDGEGGEVDWNIAVPFGVDAVKVMTIHKSKGLGFPVVILLVYGDKNRGFRYIVQHQEDAVSLLRLTKRIIPVCEEFEERYAEEEMRERVNRINSLYVALTRASRELYVVGVKGERDYFPFVLFPIGRFGQPPPSVSSGEPDESIVEAYHHFFPLAGLPAGEQALRFRQKQRGDLVHRILASISYWEGGAGDDELEEVVWRACREAGEGDAAAADLERTVREFLASEGVCEYFERRPGRTVMTEQEFADAAGHLFRMDRMILDEDRVAVLEYKTGADDGDEARHAAQMENYLRLAGEVYPDRRVEGLICYVDAKKVRRFGPGGGFDD